MPANEVQSVWLRTRQSLIDRVKGQDDDSSWDEFYQRYWRAILGYARRFGLDEKDAEDVVQEVFVKVFRHLPGFAYDRRKGRFLSWLKTLTRTTVLDTHRRRQARAEGHLCEIDPQRPGDGVEALPDPSASAEPDPWREEWERSLLVVALERVRARVDPLTYEAFRLYGLDARPAAEVAETLGITANAVYVYKHRMIAQLRDEVRVLQQE